MSGSGTSLSVPLHSSFESANARASAPTSSAARQSVLGGALSLGARVGTMQAQLDGMASGINQSLSSTVAVINGDAQALARLNDQIVNAQSRYGGQPPNDLLDQRDALVPKIASTIGIRSEARQGGNECGRTGRSLWSTVQ